MDQIWYSAQVFWGPRADTPVELGARVLRSADALAKVHLLMENWWVLDEYVERDMVPLERARQRISSIVADRVVRDDDGEPDPESGYHCDLSNTSDHEPEQVALHIHGGLDRVPMFFENSAKLTTPFTQVPDPGLVAYPTFKSALMTLIEACDATSATVLCSPLLKQPQAKGRLFRPAWMTYLAPSAATRITPPANVLCEWTSDGGLLMIAAETTFDPDNPAQVAAANAISDALLPIRDRSGL